MQFDLFEAMTALTAAVRAALPAGTVPVGREKMPGVVQEAQLAAGWMAAAPFEENSALSSAEVLSVAPDGRPAEDLRALSDRLELEALRYVRFLDMGVNT
jgi:hypothetical protein